MQAKRRMEGSSFLTIMAGRGALIKPWIFQEIKEGRELCLSAQDRISVYRQLVSHMKEHFGDDAMGWRKASYFLPWHFDFFCRYRCPATTLPWLLTPEMPGPTSFKDEYVSCRRHIPVDGSTTRHPAEELGNSSC